MREEALVIGGTGLVGNALYRAFSALPGWSVRGTTLRGAPGGAFSSLDIRDKAAVRAALLPKAPAWVLMPASTPFVDYCELHPEETRRVNVEGSLAVLEACREAGSRLVFFSSDYVFDGAKPPYREEDPPSPLNEYGRQKAAVEAEILKEGDRHLVLRTSGVYGWETEPKNFVLQVRAKLSAGQPMKVVSDVRYNPTFSDDLAQAAARLAAAGRGGLFHAAGGGRLSRLEFARMAARAFGLDESLISPAVSSDFSTPARRPPDSSLATEKVRAAVGARLLPPQQGLAEMAAGEAKWREFAGTLPRLPANR